ncbi:hypothetical protein [Shewanella psychrophila]|nr:hypothetical protein [Shewanella psychrophila]
MDLHAEGRWNKLREANMNVIEQTVTIKLSLRFMCDHNTAEGLQDDYNRF